MAKLTVKQARFVKAKAEGKSDIDAGIEAGAKTKVAASKYANRMSKDVNVQEVLLRELEKQGVTPELIVKPVVKGLQAKRVVAIEGDFYQTEVDDLDTQMKAHDRVVKLLGIKSGEASPTLNVFVNVSKQDKEEFGL